MVEADQLMVDADFTDQIAPSFNDELAQVMFSDDAELYYLPNMIGNKMEAVDVPDHVKQTLTQTIYTYHEHEATWDEAQAMCEQEGANLVSIHS